MHLCLIGKLLFGNSTLNMYENESNFDFFRTLDHADFCNFWIIFLNNKNLKSDNKVKFYLH